MLVDLSDKTEQFETAVAAEPFSSLQAEVTRVPIDNFIGGVEDIGAAMHDRRSGQCGVFC